MLKKNTWKELSYVTFSIGTFETHDRRRTTGIATREPRLK
jgi:hypothetical protein